MSRSPPSPTAAAATPGATDDLAVTAPAPPTDEPRAGGRLRLPGAEPATLDPALVGDVNSAEYLYEIYSGLVNVADDLTVIPDLAERWEVDPRGTVYTFTLRSDASFHDGRPVTAEDVAFSLRRACSPELDSKVAATYLGDIVGCLDYQAGRAEDVAGRRVEHHDIGLAAAAVDRDDHAAHQRAHGRNCWLVASNESVSVSATSNCPTSGWASSASATRSRPPWSAA